MRAVRVGRRDGRAVLGPSGARASPAVGGALHVRGLRRRPPPGRRGAAERPLPGRDPPERRDPGPPHLRRGREHPRLPRGAGALGGRRRHGAGELLGPLDQHLPGGGADPPDQDPGAGEGQPCRDGPAHGQHAGPGGARGRLQRLARSVPGRGAADPPDLRTLRDRHGPLGDSHQSRPHGAPAPGADRGAPGRELSLRRLPRVLRGGPARPGARAPRAHRRRRRHRGRLRGLEPAGPGGRELVARGDRSGGVRGREVHPGPWRGGERRCVPAHRAAGACGERGGRSKRRPGRRARRGAKARRVGGAGRAGADHPRAGVGGSVRHVVPELDRRLEPQARSAVRLLRGAGRRERGIRGGGRVERVRQRRLRQHPHHPDRGIDRERDAAAGGAVRAAGGFGAARARGGAGSACTARSGCWARRAATRC